VAKNRLFINAVQEAKRLMSQAVAIGDVCLDATCGNGHDTLFLANLVGAQGKVFAFDVQQMALDSTQKRLQLANVAERVSLINDGHQQMAEYVHEKIAGAMFNLGYLPGGNKGLVTKPNTTVAALDILTELMLPYGLITLVLYTGHPGGEEEAKKVTAWADALPQDGWDVISFSFPNRENNSPILLAIQKRGEQC